MANFNTFSPIADTVAVAASSVSASGTLLKAGETRALYVYNDLNEVVFMALGVTTAVATSAGLPIPGKAAMVFEVNPAVDKVAFISLSGSGNVYVSEGQGA